MQHNLFILKSFELFFKHNPFLLIVLFLIALFLGFSQGITIVLLIPLLGFLDSAPDSGSQNLWVKMVGTVLNRFEIEVNLTLLLLVFLFCLVSVAVLNYYQSIIQANYQQEFSYQTRKRLFKKIITSNWQFLNGKSKHSHIQVLTTEIPKVTVYYYYYLGLATKLIFIGAHVILAMIISVKFTLFVVAVGSFAFVFLRKYIKNARILGEVNIRAFREMLKHIDDFWLTVKMAKVHNTEEFCYKKFEEASSLMLKQQKEQVRNRAIPQLFFALTGIVTLVVVVAFAFSFTKLPLASLFVLILLFARIFPHFIAINSDVNMLVSNVSSVEAVLLMDQEIEEHEFAGPIMSGQINLDKQIEIKKLNFGYDSAPRLFDNFSESIPARSITGIVGKSGCGKTTLIDIVAGLQQVEDDVLYIDGKALGRHRLFAWKRELGYLPQDSFFVDGTIRENLIWDSERKISDEQIMEVLKQVNADQPILGLKNGLDTFVSNFQFHFSGGERQRLALARVLIRNPKLLLLDEATSALDSVTEAQIMECLVHLKHRVTILFVTHRPNLLQYFDKVIDLSATKTVSE